jgi:hypothetical protein
MNLRPAAGVLAIVLVLTACGGDEATDTTTTTTAPTTTTTTTTTTSTTTTPPVYPDGVAFGWIRDTQAGEIAFDPAEFLTGDEAVTAAREDGVIGPDEDLPNDFYIRDEDPATTMIAVAPGAAVTVLAFDESGTPAETGISYDDLAGLFDGRLDPAPYYGFGADGLPVWVTVSGGVVEEVAEQYLP